MRRNLTIIALVTYLLWRDPILSLVVLVVYPIAAIPVAIISEKMRKVAKRTQAELGDMTALLTEKLSSARLIKTFRLESYAADKVDKSFEDVLRWMKLEPAQVADFYREFHTLNQTAMGAL